MRRTSMAIMVVFSLLVTLIAGCGQPGSTPAANTQPAAGTQPTPTQPSTPAKAPRTGVKLVIATGGTGGVYYPLGGALAKIINEKVEGTEASVEVTGASVENLRLLHAGEVDLAMSMNDVALEALNGKGQFTDKLEVRMISTMYANLFHVVSVQSANVQSIGDLKGKRVSVGAAGSGTEVATNSLLNILGVTYDDFTVQRLPFAQQTDAMKNRTLDVGMWSVAAPTSSIIELATSEPINILNFSDADIKAIADKIPAYSPGSIKGGTYQGVDQDVQVPAVYNILAVNTKTDADLVYDITKAIFENHTTLVDTHQAAADWLEANTISGGVIPLHTGALRYFQEKGFTIPAHLIPPEAR